MTTLARQPDGPMLIADLDTLRDKLLAAEGSLAAKWASFRVLAEHQSTVHPTYSALLALVTGNAEAAYRFRRALERYQLSALSHCRSMHIQYHTWCFANPLARWAIAYDWLADQPVFGDFDEDRAADTFLEIAHSQIMPVALSREPAGDNQIASMLLACAVIGWLFGVKRGSDRRAQALYRFAMSRAHQIPDYAEAQFVGEGSVYMLGVNVAAMGLWQALLAWLGLPHDRQRWLSCQVSARNLAGAGGLTLPWDAGGLVRHFGMGGLALLARETGDVSALAMLDHFDMWRALDHCAWFDDQRAWTLIWWPDSAPDWPHQEVPLQAVFPGWFHVEIGGALDVAETGLRLFQAWDFCGGASVGGVARPQTDPNSLHLEIGGVPLTLDGSPAADCRAFDFAPEVVLSPEELTALEHDLALQSAVRGAPVTLAQRIARFTFATLAGSNALVLENEPWHYPRRNVHGVGTLWAQLPAVAAVAADCTDYYAPKYPVSRVSRTSLLLDRQLALVIDELDSDRPLTVSWQVHVRPEQVANAERRVTVATPEGPQLQILAPPSAELRTHLVAGYPKSPCGNSQRVSWQQRLQRGSMATLLVIHDDRALGRAEGAWEGGLLPADLTPGATMPALSPALAAGQLTEVVDALQAAEPARWRWFRARLAAPPAADYLRLPLLNTAAGLWQDGHCVCSPADSADGAWSRQLPFALPVAGGQTVELLIVTPSERGRLVTEAGVWYQRQPLPETTFKSAAGRWEIASGATVYTVCTTDAAVAAGWDTDARWVIARDGRIESCLQTTRLQAPGLPALDSPQPVHAWLSGGVWQTQPAVLPADPPPQTLPPIAVDLVPGAACAVAGAAGAKVAETLQLDIVTEACRRLDDMDWRIVRAAAIRLGELGDRDVCANLRRRLATELKRESLNPVTGDYPSTDWAADMAAIGSDPGCNAFRVAQALLLALHRLEDAQAAPLARRALGSWQHFYPVYHAALNLLADLGDREDEALFRSWSTYPEVNTMQAAQRALKRCLDRG